MLKNYLKITLRNLRRNSTYSLINIAGLSVGIACSILILLWVHDELSYDSFQPKFNELHQVWINGHYDGTINSFTSVSQPLAEVLKSADSHIKNTAIVDWGGEHLLTVGEQRLMKQGHRVSEAFLEMFQFPLVKGDAATVLDDPTSIVLTESAARELFGDQDPINQLVRINNDADLKVTGILKDIPKNSSFQFDCLVTWAYYKQSSLWVKNSEDDWDELSFQVFAELAPGTDLTSVNAAVHDIMKGKGKSDLKRDIFLYPMSRWRLHASFKAGVEEGGDIDYVNNFTTLAIFILIIACINFMNLATARSERRAREVGIRKSIGSQRKQLIIQFLGESILIASMSFVISLVLVELLLPFYNQLVEKQLTLDFSSPLFWSFAVGLILLTGVLSGSYPAFYLSGFQPAAVLKGKVNTGKGASSPRKVLVTLQFVFSILLIIGTMVIHEQINHIKSRELGYDQNNLLVVDYTADIDKHFSVMKEEILNAGVADALTKSQAPITAIFSNNFVEWPGKPKDEKVLFTTLRTDYDFTKTMGITVFEGRDFSEQFKSDTAAVIINKTAAKIMGLNEPIGQKLTIWERQFEVIGVVDDVLMGSLFREVPPMFMVYMPGAANYITIRLKPTNNLSASIEKVEDIVNKYNAAYPFDYTFADTEFAKKFSSIRLISLLSDIFAMLAIFITCLGLFGLASFTAEQRTKEIGIRKVLGASLGGIVLLIGKDFSKLVIFAFLLSAPLAWWFMDNYLDRYAYRINIPVWILPAAGVLALLLAWIIVSTQAIRAARTNPAQSLRSE